MKKKQLQNTYYITEKKGVETQQLSSEAVHQRQTEIRDYSSLKKKCRQKKLMVHIIPHIKRKI